MNRPQVPNDFPEVSDLGTASRIRPKLLFIKPGACSAAFSDRELRYFQCEDIAHATEVSTFGKIAKRKCTAQTALRDIEAEIRRVAELNGWEFSDAEIGWTVERTRQLLSDFVTVDESQS
ncbi:hypothetical protein [Burkholderia pseudomallei]|uniref:hypothetical protein n=1 Tax=Burkholderia pseudomallei TaxID=28450 RepID=UPI0011CEB94E|nr:hypothetical protein [Burkholderia pseudomallei]